MKKHYYNDQAHNCTYGVGTLVHLGPCTKDEMKTKVTDKPITTSLNTTVQSTTVYVKNNIGDTKITQAQFDALVSFAYNTGNAGSQKVLALVKDGKLDQVAAKIKEYNQITKKDKNEWTQSPYF